MVSYRSSGIEKTIYVISQVYPSLGIVMQRVFTLLLVLCFLVVVPARAADTLRHYNPVSKKMYFHDEDIRRYVARFEPAAPGVLTEIGLAVRGDKGASAIVRLFGNEGGSVVPVLRQELMKPVVVHKAEIGEEYVRIQLAQPIAMEQRQFFISVEPTEGNLQLLSDADTRRPVCSTDEGADYLYQYLEVGKGEWRSFHSAFRVDALVKYSGEGREKYMEDITATAGIDTTLSSSSIAWGDINDDNFPDLLVGGKLYLNQRDGTFSDITEKAGLHSTAKAYAFIDMNNDKALDVLYIGCDDHNSSCTLFLNDGTGRFTKHVLVTPPIPSPSAFAIADVNNDTYPDIFIGQYGKREGQALSNYLLVNTRELGFRDATASLYDAVASHSMGACRGAMWVDYDNDKRLDLFVTNGDGVPSELWKNNGGMQFANRAGEHNFHGDDPSFNAIGCDWADCDNDGDMDLVLAHHHPLLLLNQEYRFSAVHTSSGAPDFRFADNAGAHTPLSLAFEEQQAGGAWGDVNNDGLLDLFITTGSPCHYSELYQQQENRSFAPETFAYGLWRSAKGEDATWVDIDNDGQVDLATGHDGFFRLFRNKSNTLNNSLQLALHSASSNYQAIGGRVYVYAKDKSIMREVVAGRGRMMQSPAVINIGLGTDEHVDSVLVQWPNGSTENFGSLAPNALHTLTEGQSSQVVASFTQLKLHVYPNPMRTETSISYRVADANTVHVHVYSLQNKLVRTLVAERQLPGNYSVQWDGKDSDGNTVAAGMYVVRIRVGNSDSTARIIVNE